MDILRFTTAGSVDDGKSTLIGRLLYDTRNIKSDVIQSVSDKKGGVDINLAHITDGLRAEREQGITIDVAYKYFTTKNRKYIITDAPGHFQYTKNLVTGASGVDAIIILIDARKGITEQTRRHSMVASFLKISKVVVAVNKMDLVDYDEQVFNSIRREYLKIAEKLGFGDITFIPINALEGDNVSFKSERMKWYGGNTFEQFLENCVPVPRNVRAVRFSVQYVNKHDTEQLVYGQLISGTLRVGDHITVLPQNTNGVIAKMIQGYDELKEAKAGQNLCLAVTSETKIERGNIISFNTSSPRQGNRVEGTICWLDTDRPLQPGREYILRINSLETPCTIIDVAYKIDVNSFENIKDATPLAVNQFAKVTIETQGPIVYDEYNTIPATGRGIIIDAATNYTSGAFTVNLLQ